MTDVLPGNLRKQFRTNALSRNEKKVQDYCDLRDFIEENKEFLAHNNMLMQVYEEASSDMRVSPHTVRKNLAIIRNTPLPQLMAWVKKGLSFDHIENANMLYLHPDSPADSPHELLEQAIVYGNEEGKTMTVSELHQFATNGKKFSPFFYAHRFLKKILSLKVVNSWPVEKQIRLEKLSDELQELFND